MRSRCRLVFGCWFIRRGRLVLRSGFVSRLLVDIGFSLTIVRNVSIISTITGSGISHSLNSAITKENVVFFSGRASISGLGIAKILKQIFSNGSGQEGREYNEYLKKEIGSINFHANFEMF